MGAFLFFIGFSRSVHQVLLLTLKPWRKEAFEQTTLLSCKGDFVTFCTELTQLRNKIIHLWPLNQEKVCNSILLWCIRMAPGTVANCNYSKTTSPAFRRCCGLTKLIERLGKIVSNMQAEDTWNNFENTGRKDIALTSLL